MKEFKCSRGGKLLVVSLDRSMRERYERIRGRFEGIDITNAYQISNTAKVIGFYGRISVEELEVRLAEMTTAFFLEADEVRDEWRTQGLSLLSKFGWRILADDEEETVATKGAYGIRLQTFRCPRCRRPVFACLLRYPTADMPPGLPVQQPWCAKRFPKIREAYRPYEVRTTGKTQLAKRSSLGESVRLLSGHRAVALTGAGISKASGVSTFGGAEGLEARLKITKEGLLDGFFHSLFERPEFVVTEVAKFKASFITARPNPAHIALAQLEERHTLNFIITENGDGLHQEAGSEKVLEIWELDDLRKHFLESKKGWEALESGEILLVIGVGRDEHGLIEYARDNCLKILGIGPERPSFLTEGDLYLRGRAEELLPKIVDELES